MGPARVWRGREPERAGQYDFLPSSGLSFTAAATPPLLQCPESGNGVCLTDVISGWFQLPNCSLHHPLCTHGTSQEFHPWSQNWGRGGKATGEGH